MLKTNYYYKRQFNMALLDLLMAICALMISGIYQPSSFLEQGDAYIYVLSPLLFPSHFN
jgi:hypothetical protein